MTNEQLIKIARNAWKNSLSEISNYQVGAAIQAKSGVVYIGANIEDKTIPSLSNCAERVALQNAFSHGEREFLKIAIVGGNKDKNEPLDEISPCGVCLQYMFDFCKDIEVVLYSNKQIVSKKIKDFLNNPYELK